MKMMKGMLFAGAALVATAAVAQADDLGALKAQIEALQSRVSQLEAQPQAAMPSGYSLLSIREGQGTFQGLAPERYGDHAREDSGFTLSVVPTADAAPVAEVSVSGEIRTALVYTDNDNGDDDNLDVANRGRIFIKGKVDTAVGEVGGYFRLEATGGSDFSDYSESVNTDKAYAWWKFAPEWELLAGYTDNTAALQTSYDWLAESIPIPTVGPSNPSNEQFRLTYTSGPLSFAIALEDPDNITVNTPGIAVATKGGGFTTVGASSESRDTSDLPNVQAYLMYSTDAFTAQIVGLYQDDDFGADDWAVGGGASVGIADSITLFAAGVVGEGTSLYANNLGPGSEDDDFWGGSVGVIAHLSEDTRLELGGGIEDYDVGGTATGINGGIYWDPVSQVTLGAGATWLDYSFDDAKDYDNVQMFVGTYLRFP